MKKTTEDLFKIPDFRKLIFSQILNSLATIFLQVTVMVEVYTRTNSVFGASAVIGVMSLSSFASGMIASRIISNYRLKGILHITGLLRAVITLLIGFFLIIDQSFTYVLLYLMLIIYSFVSAWYQPARFAILPLMVAKGQYIKANSILITIQQTLMTVGWALGGVLVLLVPLFYLIVFISLLFAFAGLAAKLISVNEVMDGVKRKNTQAWKKVWSIPVVRSITLMETLEGMANAIWTSALLLSFTFVVLNQEADVWGYLNATYFIGAILGSLIVIWKSKMLEKKIGVMIGLSGMSMGALTLVFSMNEVVVFALLLCVLMGPMYQARDICQSAVLQSAIEERDRASVMAARMAFLTPWNGIMVMVVGLLADFVGVQTIYIVAGIIYLIASLIAFKSRALRDYTLTNQ